MQNHGTLIVPLFSGSGVRIKVIDALCLEVPIISTELGADGLNIIPNFHYEMANTENEFISVILNENINKKLELTKNGFSFAIENFDSTSVVNTFYTQIKNL